MPIPSVTGGVTVLNTCDTGSGGVSPLSPIGGTPLAATSIGNGYETGINLTGSGTYNPSGNTQSSALMGGIYAVTTTDFSVANRLAFFHYYNTSRVSAITLNTGLMLYVNSNGTGTQEAAWAVNGGNNPISSFDCAVVNMNRSTDAHLYSGTFDVNNISHMGSAATFSTNYSNVVIDSFGYVDPYVVINGTSGDKGSFLQITTNTNSLNTLVNVSPTDNIHLCFFAWGVGDGSTLTHFSDILKVWEFAKQVDFSSNYGRAHINDNDIGYEANASSSDVIYFELCNWISDTPFFWNSIGSSSATVNYLSCVIKNAGESTISDGHDFNAVTFDGCSTLSVTDPSFTNVIIKNSTATVALDIISASNQTGTSLSGNTTAMRFNFAGSSSVTLTNVSFSTNTTDIEYTGSGVLTVTISGGSTPTTNASGSGSIVLVAPAKGIIFSGLLATSQVVVYATGTTTERFRVNSSGTGETYTATIEEDVDYTILLPGQVPIRKTVTVGGTQVAEGIQQVVDRAYVASSGLVYTTDATANESTKIFTLTKASTLQNYYSFMMEEWKDNDTGANQNLRNVTFPIIPNGPNSFTLDDTWEFAGSTDIAFLSRDGLRYLDASSVETAAWSAILTTGDVTGFTAEIQQVIGAAPIDAANTGVVDELVQIYGDASHGNFNYRGYMVIKYQVAGYYQGEVDVVSTYGGADLSDELYIVSLQPTLANITASDPAVSITITNHGASPVTWNGKVYSLTITDTTGLSGTIIQQEINYNLAQDATFQSEDPFNWSDMVYDNGTKFKTERGTLINSAGALLKGIRVVQADGTTPHADFDSFMADDGTTFAPAIQVTVSAANLVDGTRYQFYNVTQASELDNALVSGGSGASLSALFGPGEVIENGDVIRMRATYQSTTTAKIPLDSEAVASSGGVSFINTQVDDSIYILYGLDGSTITKFTADFVNDEIDLIVASNFSAQELYAWWTYTLTTVQGVQEFYGGVTAIDSANLRINNATIDVFFDNTTTTNVFQSDNIRIYRSDDAYPIKNPTTGGGGIDIVWKNQIFIAETGVSGLTPAESTQLGEIDTVSTKVDKTLTTNLFIGLK